MYKMLIDTCVWLNLAKDPRQLPLFDVVEEMVKVGDDLINKACQLTGIKEKTSLVNLELEALISRKSSRRLAKLGVSEKKLKVIPRRRI